tara:strand:+ start:133 stop:1059 length:927 start_codon:yes stop_codon:yes gene_type:complete
MDESILINKSDFYNALDDKKLMVEQKNKIITKLIFLLEHEQRKAPEFKYENYDEITKKEFRGRFSPYFKSHNDLLLEFFPPETPAVMFELIDKLFMDELLNHLSGLETARISSYKINEHNCDWLFATTSHKDKFVHFVEEGSYDDLKMLIIKQHPTIKKLHHILRKTIKNAVGSPFSIVNTKAWIKPPQIRKLPYSFPVYSEILLPGHSKIFIYLTPMNKDYGYFMLHKNEIIDKPAGICILFKSDNIYFKDVPGEIHERFCLEVTIQRTFVDLNQNHDGHPIAMSYASLNSALTNHSDDGTIILRTD